MIQSLISKMTKAEKRFFSLRSNSIKENPEHFRLFKFLSKPHPKEKKLEDLDPGYVGNSASIKKKYLKESIMDSLRAFNRNSTIGIIIMNHIQDAEILYRKLMFKECMKSLRKAKKLAVKHERFGLHIEILNWERRLIGSTMELYDVSEEMIDKEEGEIHKKNNNELKARKLQASVFEFKKKYGYLDQSSSHAFSKIFSQQDFEKGLELNSRRASFYYNWTMSIYYTLKLDYEKSYENSKNIDERYKDVVDPEDLFYGMLEHLTSCIYTHRYSETIEKIDVLKNFKNQPQFKNNIAIEERFFYYQTNYSFISYLSMGEEEKAQILADEIQEIITGKESALSEQMLSVLRNTLTQGHFLLGNYKSAKYFCQQNLAKPKSQLREDMYKQLKLLYPLILFELKEYDLLESEIQSSKNYFLKLADYTTWQLDILNLLQKMPDLTKNENQKYFRQIAELTAHKFTSSKGSVTFDNLVFMNWALSRVHGRTCMEEFAMKSGY